MAIYIYGLVCPLARAIRYIGKSADPELRLGQHMRLAKRKQTHRDRWLCALRNANSYPTLVVLRILEDNDDWAAAEKDEIAKAREAGLPLTNLTKGGDGAALVGEARARHLATTRDPERCRKISEAKKRFLSDPNERAKLAESNRRRARDPVAKAKQAEAQRRYWADPERSAAHREKITSAERLREKSKEMKNCWADPEYRARLSEVHKRRWRKRKGG